MADTKSATPAKSVSELRKEDLINRVYNYYIGQGFPPAAAAYMVGSLLQESNLDPTAHQKVYNAKTKTWGTGPGRGLGQWTDDPDHNSFTALKTFARDNGTTWDDISVQLQFTIQQRPDVTAQFKKADTEAKAKAAATAFENFDPNQAGARWDIAGTILKNVQAHNSPGNGLGSRVTDGPAGELIQDLEDHFNLQDVYGVIKQCRKQQQDGENVPANVAPPNHTEVVTGTILKK